jgi:hypothetical protein
MQSAIVIDCDSHTKTPAPIAAINFCVVRDIRSLGYKLDYQVIDSRRAK